MADNDNVHSMLPSTDIASDSQVSISDMKAKMARMKEMIQMKRDFLKSNLAQGINNDYAVIPGTKKPSLLKPGAEKLLDWHGYYPSFIAISLTSTVVTS
jgi:hypothetical protein